jgi:L-seryl-tRNA(Ser) seleniumtransferase
MEKLLSSPESRPLIHAYGREQAKQALRAAARSRAGLSIAEIVTRARRILVASFAPEIERVINATGVLIHTNLGRAPLSAPAREALLRAAEGYAAIELDLATGRRGLRGGRTREHLARLLGAQDALVVNNNAAAVLLALATVAAGREVLVSRGELVAIGGSFQIPEILEASGCRLREVGTTNRTRIGDYEKAHRREVAALLTVHPSNYEVKGFVERPEREELARFAARKRIPWIHDQGAGNLIDLSEFGIPGEERVTDVLAAGASLVTFSGDKLFGGPQAGVLAGRRRLVAAAAAHPIARAVRVGKLTLAAFEATVAAWRRGAREELPLFRMAAEPLEHLRRRAEAIRRCLPAALTAETVATRAVFGGGTTPEKSFPSAGIAIRGPVPSEEAASRLRRGCPAVLARVERGRMLIDLRTVDPGQDKDLLTALCALA